jgi:hypothetical protein
MDPSLFQCGDWDLWVQIAALADLQVLPEPLTTIRVRSHGQNLSAPSSAGHNRSNGEAVEILRRYGHRPILGQSDLIFGESIEAPIAADDSSECSTLVRLGLMATSSQHRHHRLAGIEFLRAALRRADGEGGLSQETRARAAHRLFLVSGELSVPINPNLPPPDWVELLAQLFWRSGSDSFSEDQSIRVRYCVSTTPIRLQLTIPPVGSQLASLRLDLTDQPVRLLLHELTLCSMDGEVLWRCASTSNSFQMLGMNWQQPASGPGILVHLLDHDPQWMLPLSPDVAARLDRGGVLNVTLQRP